MRRGALDRLVLVGIGDRARWRPPPIDANAVLAALEPSLADSNREIRQQAVTIIGYLDSPAALDRLVSAALAGHQKLRRNLLKFFEAKDESRSYWGRRVGRQKLNISGLHLWMSRYGHKVRQIAVDVSVLNTTKLSFNSDHELKTAVSTKSAINGFCILASSSKSDRSLISEKALPCRGACLSWLLRYWTTIDRALKGYFIFIASMRIATLYVFSNGFRIQNLPGDNVTAFPGL